MELLAAASGHATHTLTDSESEKEEEGDGMRTESPAQRARWLYFFHSVREVEGDAYVVCMFVAAYNCRDQRSYGKLLPLLALSRFESLSKRSGPFCRVASRAELNLFPTRGCE